MANLKSFKALLDAAFANMKNVGITPPKTETEIGKWLWGKTKPTIAAKKSNPNRVTFIDLAYIAKEAHFSDSQFKDWLEVFGFTDTDKTSKSRSGGLGFDLSEKQKQEIAVKVAREIRKEGGIILEEVPEYLGVATMTWCRYESGEQVIPPMTVDVACWLLGLNPAEYLKRFEDIANLENIYDLKKF